MNESKQIKIGGNTVIGMVHCLPLPGMANFDGNYEKIITQAVEDAITLEKAGVNAVLVENMGDTPFSDKLENAQIVALTAAAQAVKSAVSLPVGIDAAFNDCVTSLSIAGIIGASFVRIPVFVDTVIFSNGIINPCARQCMNYRKAMGLEHVQVLADVQVKHAHMLLPTISLEQSAQEAVANGADGIIVTGSVIGAETPLEMITRVKKVASVPVLAGSGVKASNIREQFQIADGAIIGSSMKKGGILTNPIDYALVREVVEAI